MQTDTHQIVAGEDPLDYVTAQLEAHATEHLIIVRDRDERGSFLTMHWDGGGGACVIRFVAPEICEPEAEICLFAVAKLKEQTYDVTARRFRCTIHLREGVHEAKWLHEVEYHLEAS